MEGGEKGWVISVLMARQDDEMMKKFLGNKDLYIYFLFVDFPDDKLWSQA